MIIEFLLTVSARRRRGVGGTSAARWRLRVAASYCEHLGSSHLLSALLIQSYFCRLRFVNLL